MNLMIIGDPHAHPEYDNSRFEKLGKFIVKTKPDIVVCMRDFADMPSLSSYDRGTKGFDGKRYFTDIKHQDLLYRRFNTNQKNNKKKVYELLFKFQK